MLDLAALEAAPLESEPFDHCMVPGFLPARALATLGRDFPAIRKGGSFPLAALACGPSLLTLAEKLQGPEVTAAFSRKFGLDLSGHPTLLTLRGWSRRKDGRIHKDSSSKLITALLYLNDSWSDDGGRLRLLRSPHDIEDYGLEVTPRAGTLLAFRCGETAWHGHKPYVGVRRSLQLNWVTDESVLRREQSRHGLSAWFKTLLAERPGR